MRNASKAKGSKFELEVVKYLQEHGYPNAERKLAGKSQDTGDIANGPLGFCLELKNAKRHDLSGWLKEAELEARHAGEPWGVVIMRRTGTSERSKDYVLLALDTFLDVVKNDHGK